MTAPLIAETLAFNRFWTLRRETDKTKISFPIAALAMFLLQILFTIFINALYTTLGLKFPSTVIKLNVLAAILLTLSLILEDLIFRGAPLLLAWVLHRYVEGNFFYWGFGILSTVVFSLLHLTNLPPFETQYLLLILKQLLRGLIFYWIARTWGLGSSMLYHILQNGLSAIVF